MASVDATSFLELLNASEKLRNEHYSRSKGFAEEIVKLLSDSQRRLGYYTSASYSSLDELALQDGYVKATIKIKTLQFDLRVKRLTDNTYSVIAIDNQIIIRRPSEGIDFVYQMMAQHEYARNRIYLGLPPT